ncbi:MAG: hypothetical protein AAF745_12370, partial [Planctomycetota bacterium]
AILGLALTGARYAFVNEALLLDDTALASHAPRWGRWANTVTLTLSAMIAVGTVSVMSISFGSEMLSTPNREYVWYQVRMNQAGELFESSRTIRDRLWREPVYKVRPLGSDEAFEEVDNNWPDAAGTTFTELDESRGNALRSFHYLTGVQSDRVPTKRAELYEHNGMLLVYAVNRGLHAVVTPDGVFKSIDQATGAFKNLVFAGPSSLPVGPYQYQTTGSPLFADDNGLYQLDEQTLSVRKLLDGPVDAVSLLLKRSKLPTTLWTRSGNRVSEHKLTVLDEGKSLPVAVQQDPNFSFAMGFTQVSIASTREFNLAMDDRPGTLTILRTSDNRIAAVKTIIAGPKSKSVEYQFLNEAGPNDSPKFASLTVGNNQNADELQLGWAMPPGLLLGIMTYLSWIDAVEAPQIIVFSVVVSIVTHSIVAALIAFLLSRRFQLSPTLCWRWVLGAILLGLGTALAMISRYRRPITAAGEQCDQPPSSGIEIFDSRDAMQPAKETVTA